MAGSDELIYRIKFEADEQSKENIKRSVKELSDEQKKSGSGKLNEQLRESIKVGEQYNENNMETIERLVELRKQIDGYRQSLAEIRKAKRDGLEITDQQREKEVEIRGALKEASQAYRDNQKDLMANKSAVQGSAVSYNQLAAETKLLEQQIRNVPINEQNAEYKELQKQIAENKSAMKDFNAELGDHSMNVGNYAEALSTAASGLAVIQGPLGPLAGRLNSLNTTISRSIPLLKSKIAMWGALKIAIGVATGGVTIVLGVIIAALSKMQPIIDQVTKRFEQLGAIWDKASDSIGALFGLNEATNLSMGESIKLAGELADAEVALREERLSMISTLAEMQTQIAILRRDAEDESNTYRERIDMMNEAIQLTEENFAAQIEMQKEELRIASERNDMFRSEFEQREAVAKIEEELIRLEGQSAMQQRQLVRRKQSIINSLRVEEERRRKNIQAIRDEAREAIQATRDRIAELRKAAQDDLMSDRQQRLIDFLRGQGQERAAIIEETEAEINKIEGEFEDKREEAQEKSLETQLALTEKYIQDGFKKRRAADKALVDSKKWLRKELIAIDKAESDAIINISENTQARLAEINQQEVEDRENIRKQIEKLRRESAIRQSALEKQVRTQAHQDLLILEAQKEQTRLELLDEFREKEFSEEEALRLSREQSELEFEKSTQEAKTAIREAELQNRLDLEQAYADLTFGALNALFGDTKAVQVATAIVDTYTAANKALASAPPPLSYVRAAAAVAMGVANVRKILKTEPGDKNVQSGGASQTAALSSTRGFEVMDDRQTGDVARQIAETSSGGSSEMNPTFVFEGDLNSEVMAIKVRKGNRTIDSKTLTTKSRA